MARAYTMSIPCILYGTEYKTIREACTENELHYKKFVALRDKHPEYSMEQLAEKLKNTPKGSFKEIDYEGVTYPSLRALARHLNVNDKTFRRVRNTFPEKTVDEVVEYMSKSDDTIVLNVRINGEVITSITRLAQVTGIKRKTIWSRVRSGFTGKYLTCRSYLPIRYSMQERLEAKELKMVHYKNGSKSPTYVGVRKMKNYLESKELKMLLKKGDVYKDIMED